MRPPYKAGRKPMLVPQITKLRAETPRDLSGALKKSFLIILNQDEGVATDL